MVLFTTKPRVTNSYWSCVVTSKRVHGSNSNFIIFLYFVYLYFQADLYRLLVS